MRDFSDPGPPKLRKCTGPSMNNNLFRFPSARTLRGMTLALGAALTLALLSGCAGFPKPWESQTATPPAEAEAEAAAKVAEQPAAKPAPIPEPEPPKKTKLYEWTGQGRSVSRIVVDVDEQKARFYEGDKEVGWTMVASGVSKFPTPVGRFSVTEKVANKESNLYGKIYGKGGQLISSNAKMGKTPVPAGARFDGADMPFYMRLTGDGIGMHAGPIPNPGRPASHGCIRMPKAFAPIAFRHVGVGTEVSIVGNGPSYSTYLAQQRAQAPRTVAAAKPAAPKPQGEGRVAAGAAQGAPATSAVESQSVGTAAAGAAGVAVAVAAAGQDTSESAAQTTAAVEAAPKVATPAATPAQPQAPVTASQAPAAPIAPQAASSAPAPAPAPTAPVAPAPVEAPKVPAVAHTPAPPVAPAIATRTESAAAPAVNPAQVQIAPNPPAPAVASKAEGQPAAPAPVYKPVPQVPEFRAPAPVAAPAAVPAPASVETAAKSAG